MDGTGTVWDSGTGRRVVELARVGQGAIFGPSFSPDDRRVLAAREDGIGRVWEARSGRLLFALVGHEN